MKRIISLALCLILALSLFSGCSISVKNPTESPLAGDVSQSGDEKPGLLPGGNGTAENPEGDGADSGEDEPADTEQDSSDEDSESSDIPVETLPKIWVINVNDTQKTQVTMNGGDGNVTYDLTVTLKVWMTKGGDTPLGGYTGTAALKYEFTLDKGQYGGNAKGAGADKEVKFTLEDFDRERFDKPVLSDPDTPVALDPDDEQLASLVKYETMALGAFHFDGSGDVDEWTENGGEWSGSGSEPVTAQFNIGIKDGIVDIYLPDRFPGVIFKGTLNYQSQ